MLSYLAGVARGGHYYSYIKERDGAERWFTFDDDRISPFDPANIEDECFGGTGMRQVSANFWLQWVFRYPFIQGYLTCLLLHYRVVRSSKPGVVPLAALWRLPRCPMPLCYFTRRYWCQIFHGPLILPRLHSSNERLCLFFSLS